MEIVGFENMYTPNFKMFPNPVNDYCMIELPFSVENKRINVMNSLGQITHSYLINGAQFKLETQVWPKGIYIVQIEGFGNSRLIKQ
jgi:hypothetical protein